MTFNERSGCWTLRIGNLFGQKLLSSCISQGNVTIENWRVPDKTSSPGQKALVANFILKCKTRNELRGPKERDLWLLSDSKNSRLNIWTLEIERRSKAEVWKCSACWSRWQQIFISKSLNSKSCRNSQQSQSQHYDQAFSTMQCGVCASRQLICTALVLRTKSNQSFRLARGLDCSARGVSYPSPFAKVEPFSRWAPHDGVITHMGEFPALGCASHDPRTTRMKHL